MNNEKHPWTHEQFLAYERRRQEAQKQERDTHFAGVARLLLKDMFAVYGRSFIDFSETDEPECEAYQQLFARRAYDLVVHALNTCSLEAFEIMGNGAQEVPDLKEWPKENE